MCSNSAGGAGGYPNPHATWDEAYDDGAVMQFRQRYGFASDFYVCTFTYNGREYRSAEAAFQAAKCAQPTDREWIGEMTPARAKAAGGTVEMRRDWEDVKREVMRNVLLCKFSQNPELREELLQTYPRWLYEGNDWGDTYWGVVAVGVERRLVGENWLGRTLLAIREGFIVDEISGRRI